MKKGVLPCMAAGIVLCAQGAAAAFPMFFSVEYTGDAALGALSFQDTTIRADAKGTTEDIITTATAAGPLHAMPVSVVITVEGLGPVDIHEDLWWYSYSDFGFGALGFTPSRTAITFVGGNLTGFDLTTSLGPTGLQDVSGTATTLLATIYGPMSLSGGGPTGASFTAVAFNPAPGSAVAMMLGFGWVAGRRRRGGRSTPAR